MKNLYNLFRFVTICFFLNGLTSAYAANSGLQLNGTTDYGNSLYKLNLPDLVVDSIEVVNTTSDNGVTLEVPVRITVRNQGSGYANYSYLKLFYKHLNLDNYQWFLAGFQRSDHSLRNGHTPKLAPGESVTLNGTVYLSRSMKNTYILLHARTDSCAGLEFVPRYCYVFESNEKNNTSRNLFVYVR